MTLTPVEAAETFCASTHFSAEVFQSSWVLTELKFELQFLFSKTFTHHSAELDQNSSQSPASCIRVSVNVSSRLSLSSSVRWFPGRRGTGWTFGPWRPSWLPTSSSIRPSPAGCRRGQRRDMRRKQLMSWGSSSATRTCSGRWVIESRHVPFIMCFDFSFSKSGMK